MAHAVVLEEVDAVLDTSTQAIVLEEVGAVTSQPCSIYIGTICTVSVNYDRHHKRMQTTAYDLSSSIKSIGLVNFGLVSDLRLMSLRSYGSKSSGEKPSTQFIIGAICIFSNVNLSRLDQNRALSVC